MVVLPWRLNHATIDPERARRTVGEINRAVARRLFWRRMKRLARVVFVGVFLAAYLVAYMAGLARLVR